MLSRGREGVWLPYEGGHTVHVHHLQEHHMAHSQHHRPAAHRSGVKGGLRVKGELQGSKVNSHPAVAEVAGQKGEKDAPYNGRQHSVWKGGLVSYCCGTHTVLTLFLSL